MSGAGPRILWLQGEGEEYLADSLLHGLRTLLGDAVVDVPRRDALYADYPSKRELYGRGFTLYARMPDVDVDRERPLERALAGEFDLVVLPDIWRNWEPWKQLRPRLSELREKGVQVVAIDGGDGPPMYPYGPSFWRHGRLPRAHGRVPFFKREITPLTGWLRFYGLVPPPPATKLIMRHVQPIAFSIPEEHLADASPERSKLMATHVVDPEVAEVVPGTRTGYVFDEEADYFADLRASRFGITTKKAGWDCLRHYELAAAGCVPCFRDLHRKPRHCAPHGLDETNCVPYTSAAGLLEELESMSEARYRELHAGTLAWARRNTTRARAEQFLRAVGAA